MTTNTGTKDASPGGTHKVGRTLIEVDRTVSVDYVDDEHDFDQNEVGDDVGEKGAKVDYEKRIFHQSSHDMLSAAADSILEDQSMIQDFINQIKDNTHNSPQTSDFRARRLTFGKAPLQMKEDEEDGDGDEDAFVPSSPNPDGEEMGAMTPMLAPHTTITRRLSHAPASAFKPRASGRYERQRTTIYASAEIGVQQKATQPFPKDIMGTFSCHGIEPGYDEDDEDGIHQKDNQDRGCCVYPFKSHPREALFMVLDGHGPQGDAVSEFAMRQVVVSLERSENMSNDPETTLKDAFIKTNAALMVTPIEYMTSGTTLVAVYMRETHFWIAHVGDSRVVCAVQEGDELVAHNACEDHKPDNPDEKARIEAWGGFVSPAPEEGMSSRVWLDEDWTMIGLAMARSIGDYAVKDVGVIPEPDVQRHDVTENHKFMILASDGVWEFISSQEAVEIVASKIHLGADMACENLIHQATERWAEEEGDYRDDITAIVFTFPLPWKTQHVGSTNFKKKS
jgi:serine/threonine protein phosphatase PrpC